jgi:thioredoxin 1
MKSFLLSLLIFAGATAGAEQRFVSEFAIAGLSCAGCESTAREALQKISGVTKAEVLFDTGRGRIEATRAVSEGDIRRALQKFGFEARFAGDPVLPPLTDAERAQLDIRVASRGAAFDVRKQLAPGKYTIVDFWAEWCGPCHVLTPKIERLVKESANVALRTIDLQSWDSAAAKQATAEFKLAGLPYVRVYGPDGKFIGAVVGNDIEKIKSLIRSQAR